MSDEYVEYLKNDAKRMELALRLFDYPRELLEFDHGWTPGDMLPEGTGPRISCLKFSAAWRQDAAS